MTCSITTGRGSATQSTKAEKSLWNRASCPFRSTSLGTPGASATELAYSVYTIAPETVAKFGGRPLYLTIPFVLYGIFRYLYLMYAQDKGGNPSEHLLRDRATLVNVVLWAVAVLSILTWPRG